MFLFYHFYKTCCLQTFNLKSFLSNRRERSHQFDGGGTLQTKDCTFCGRVVQTAGNKLKHYLLQFGGLLLVTVWLRKVMVIYAVVWLFLRFLSAFLLPVLPGDAHRIHLFLVCLPPSCLLAAPFLLSWSCCSPVHVWMLPRMSVSLCFWPRFCPCILSSDTL